MKNTETSSESTLVSNKYYTENWFQNSKESYRILQQFLNNCAISQDEVANIVSVSDPKVRSKISGSLIYEFFKVYDKCRLENLSMHVTEKTLSPDDPKGIMLDFDIYQKNNISLLAGKDSIITSIVSIYFQHLYKFVDLFQHENDYYINIFITKRPKTPIINIEKQVYKDGFHVLIPEIMISKKVQTAILLSAIPDITELFRDKFRDEILNIDPNDNYGDLIDKACCHVPIILLGSDKIGVSKPTPELYLYQTLNIRNSNTSFNDFTTIPFKRLSKFNISYELSLVHVHVGIQYTPLTNKREFVPRDEGMISAIVNKNKIVSVKENDEYQLFDKDISIKSLSDPNLRTVSELCDMLSASRMTQYDTWMKFILLMSSISICGDNEAYKSITLRTSQKSGKYSGMDNNFLSIWNSGKTDGCTQRKYTIGTLYFWAAEDNPIRYLEWQKTNIAHTVKIICIQYAGKINHAQVARILYAMFSHKYRYNVHYNKSAKDICDGPWFEFITDKDYQAHPLWHFKYMPCETPSSMEEYIANILPKIVMEQANCIKNDLEKGGDEDDKSRIMMLKTIYKNLSASAHSFGMSAFVKGVIDMAKKAFRDEQLYEKINATPYLLPVQNGILDLNPFSKNENGKFKVKLIQDKHDYFVSNVVPVPYTPWKDISNTIAEIETRIINRFIPEPDMRKYFMLYLSTGVIDGVKDLLFLELVGGGENGKSIIMSLYENTLRGYTVPADMSVLSHITNDPSKHSSHIAAFKHMRMIRLNESEPNTVIAQSSLKKLLSGEDLSYRESFGRQSKMTLCANIIVTTNFEPNIPTNDHGTWRRILQYVCKCKFVHTNPTNQFEHKADHGIGEFIKSPHTQRAFLTLLLHWYEILQNEYGGTLKNLTPKEFPTIYRETQEYRNRQDHINNFIFRKIVFSPNNHEYNLSEVSLEYKKWYETHIGTHCKFTISNLITLFENSRLKKFLTKRHGDVFLTSHRILKIDGEMDEGELMMIDYDMQNEINKDEYEIGIYDINDDDSDDDIMESMFNNDEQYKLLEGFESDEDSDNLSEIGSFKNYDMEELNSDEELWDW